MSEIVGDNTNPLITKCKDYGVKFLKEIIYKHKVINNIPLTKTQLSKFNKRQLFDFIDTHSIDIDKYTGIDYVNFQYTKCFMFDIRYYCINTDKTITQNPINKKITMNIKLKYFKFLNHFTFLFC